MKATIKLLTVAGFAGLSLAACGTNKSSAVSSTSNSTSAGSTTTLPANTPVGFNAAKTEFVLPNNLGLLPASELALAKSDSAYAKGLANSADWFQFTTYLAGKAHAKPTQVHAWFYVASPVTLTSSQGLYVAGSKSYTISINQSELTFGTVAHLAPVSVQAKSLNLLTSHPSERSVNGPELLSPSSLEIQAAPTGSLTVNNSSLAAFCVPTPEAYISHGKVVAAGNGMPIITAGPSVVFAGANITSTSATAPKNGPVLYDKGVSSCASFS